jgi:hypothetical protein
MPVYSESFHFVNVDEIPDDIFEEGKEWVVAHDTEDSLSNSHFYL